MMMCSRSLPDAGLQRGPQKRGWHSKGNLNQRRVSLLYAAFSTRFHRSARQQFLRTQSTLLPPRQMTGPQKRYYRSYPTGPSSTRLPSAPTDHKSLGDWLRKLPPLISRHLTFTKPWINCSSQERARPKATPPYPTTLHAGIQFGNQKCGDPFSLLFSCKRSLPLLPTAPPCNP